MEGIDDSEAAGKRMLLCSRERNVRMGREVLAEGVCKEVACEPTRKRWRDSCTASVAVQGQVKMLESDSQVDQRSVDTEMQTGLKYYQSA